jgi:hypothetical protein
MIPYLQRVYFKYPELNKSNGIIRKGDVQIYYSDISGVNNNFILDSDGIDKILKDENLDVLFLKGLANKEQTHYFDYVDNVMRNVNKDLLIVSDLDLERDDIDRLNLLGTESFFIESRGYPEFGSLSYSFRRFGLYELKKN